MRSKGTSIRKKLILALIASVGMAGFWIFFLCILMILASASMDFAVFFNNNILWFVVLFILVFAGLTLLFFVMLVKKKIIYLETITASLESIAEGKFDVNLQISSEDELGKMAQTVNDMAQRLKTSIEEERRQEQMKTSLITNLSHDLRTPLTSVLGYLELLRKAEDREIDWQELSRYIEPAYNQCVNLKDRVEELFAFTKFSNREMKLNPVRFRAGELLEQILSEFLPELERAGLALRFKVPEQRLLVEGDPQLLKRVFENLLSNAVRYGSGGSWIDVEIEGEGATVAIHFINYGEPIPAHDISHIFERFYRGDKARTRPAEGSGLGLAIAESIVKLHGGSITVNSGEGRTDFTIRMKAYPGINEG